MLKATAQLVSDRLIEAVFGDVKSSEKPGFDRSGAYSHFDGSPAFRL